MMYGPVCGTDKLSDGYKRLLNSAMCSNPTGRTIVAKCVSTGIHKGLWSVMLYGTMKMVLMRTPVEIKPNISHSTTTCHYIELYDNWGNHL